MDLIFRNTRIDDSAELTDVGVDGGKIVEIKSGIAATAKEDIDAAGRVLIPGLIESHLHLEKAYVMDRKPNRSGTLMEAIAVTAELKPTFTRDDIEKIARTFHAWQQGEGYENVSGFCHAATLEAVRKHEHVLTPGRYVGTAEQEEDGEPFAETMQRLTAQLAEQFVESTKLEAEIKKNLAGLGYSLEKQESEHE